MVDRRLNSLHGLKEGTVTRVGVVGQSCDIRVGVVRSSDDIRGVVVRLLCVS